MLEAEFCGGCTHRWLWHKTGRCRAYLQPVYSSLDPPPEECGCKLAPLIRRKKVPV